MSGPLNGTALSSGVIPPPQRKVWRVNLYAQELIDAGFFPDMINPWDAVFKPLLIAKGLPEGFTLDRTPARISPMMKDGEMIGLTLEFE